MKQEWNIISVLFHTYASSLRYIFRTFSTQHVYKHSVSNILVYFQVSTGPIAVKRFVQCLPSRSLLDSWKYTTFFDCYSTNYQQLQSAQRYLSAWSPLFWHFPNGTWEEIVSEKVVSNDDSMIAYQSLLLTWMPLFIGGVRGQRNSSVRVYIYAASDTWKLNILIIVTFVVSRCFPLWMIWNWTSQ